MQFQGKGKTLSKPFKFIAATEFTFGDRTIPKNSSVKQFETQNFGWTSWIDPNTGLNHLAKE